MQAPQTEMFKVLWNIKKSKTFFPTIIIDVGACTGTNGLYGLYTDPSPFYLLVEPLHECNERLRYHMKTKHYEIQNVCLSNEIGRGVLNVLEEKKDSSYLVDESQYEAFQQENLLNVPVTTLDHLFFETPYKSHLKKCTDIIIKIDVQGAEADVIKGGLNLIGNHNCVLIVEVGTNRNKSITIFSVLETLGYQLIDCIDFMSFETDEKVTSQFDAVFMKTIR